MTLAMVQKIRDCNNSEVFILVLFPDDLQLNGISLNFTSTCKSYFHFSPRESRWPRGQCVRLQIERSGFEPWPGTLRCVHGQGTVLSLWTSISSRGGQGTVLSLWTSIPSRGGQGTVLSLWTSIPSKGGGRVKILLVASFYRNKDKLRSVAPLGSYTDFTFTFYLVVWKSDDLLSLVYDTLHKDTSL